MLSIALRYCIKKAFVRDNFTKSVLENFTNGSSSSNAEIKTIGDPALYLKEWEKDEENGKEIAVGDNNRIFDETVQIFSVPEMLIHAYLIIMQSALHPYWMA